MSSRKNNDNGNHTCHLCARSTPSQPLCRPCQEMIERLERIWPQVNAVTRGMLHYRSLRAAEPAAAAAHRAGQAARG